MLRLWVYEMLDPQRIIDPSIYYHQKINPKYIDQNDMQFVRPGMLREIGAKVVFPARRLSKEPVLLDLCCRTGYYIEALAKSQDFKCRVIGIEALPEYVKAGRARKREIIQGDAVYCNEYFPEEYFDGVIAMHAIEHLEDPILALKNLRKVVKTGARAFVVIPREGKGLCLSHSKHTNKPLKHRYVVPTIDAIRQLVSRDIWKIDNIRGEWEIYLTAI